MSSNTGASTALSGTFATRYVIQRQLGHGGTALVYLARDLQRGHDVAVKVLRPELLESVAADRFLKEIRLSQQLHHPNVVPVLDAGDHAGQLYLVLPYMEGGTLRTRMVRERQLPVTEVVSITQGIAAALTYAHEKGFVHRDVKPENILFTSGQVCLSDFGIARALERAIDDIVTSTSIVRGTPPYMSPEQASGERDLDGRSDLYSLACVVYEMLAGIQPFVGPTPESVIAQRLVHPPRPLRVYRATLPAAMEGVLDKALSISRADRFQTVTEFGNELARAAEGINIVPTGDAAVVRRFPRRLLIAGAALMLVAAVATFAIRAGPNGAEDRGIPAGDPRRVAILYFEDRTPNSIPVHVADGITEDLIDRLGSVRALHVISPYGVRQFRGSNASFDSLSRALQAGTIVTGSIARSENTVRINVRFINGRTGQQLDSRTLERPWTEWFTLQDQLAEQVAFFLRQRLGEEIALLEQRHQTSSYAAWELAQRARMEHRRAVEPRTSRGGPTAVQLLLQADSLYGRAQQLDPSWIGPVIGRGAIANAMSTQAAAADHPTPAPPSVDSIAYLRMSGNQRLSAWLNRAIELSDTALARSPGSADALTLRGESRLRLLTLLRAGDSLVPHIERDLRAALDARPDAAAAWAQLARLWVTQGRFADAAAAAQRAVEADAFYEVRPLTSIAFSATLHAEQFDAAARWCRLGMTRYPGDPRFAECELTLVGWTGAAPSEVNRAWDLLRGVETTDSMRVLNATWAYRRLMVAAVLARSGAADSARSVLRLIEAQQRVDPNKRITPLGEAYVYHLLGENDAALGALRQHLRESPNARAQLAQHPWFRDLHSDARFQALIRPAP